VGCVRPASGNSIGGCDRGRLETRSQHVQLCSEVVELGAGRVERCRHVLILRREIPREAVFMNDVASESCNRDYHGCGESRHRFGDQATRWALVILHDVSRWAGMSGDEGTSTYSSKLLDAKRLELLGFAREIENPM